MTTGIKKDIKLSEDFMVSCLEKGGKLHFSEKGMECEAPPQKPASPASAPASAPKR